MTARLCRLLRDEVAEELAKENVALTGSYYTPPGVVQTMVRLVDDVLRGPRVTLPSGLIARPAFSTRLGAFGPGYSAPALRCCVM